MKLDLEQDVMAVNRRYAAENRRLFAEAHVYAVNILGSPGAGKTTLLERTLSLLPKEMRVAVIEGDLATAKDAGRIAALGVDVVQINTDGTCHLDAKMVSRVLPVFDLETIDLLLIENVGNLVCPAGFDLGEDHRMVVLSVAEGGDKPSKYPTTFLTADTVVLNKMDLLPYLDTDVEAVKRDLFEIKPDVALFATACRKDALSGLAELASYWEDLVKTKREKN